MSEHELWNELGNLYFMSGSYEQAIWAYDRSIQMESGFGRPYSNLALAYVQQGKYQQAIELYRTSLELLVDDKDKALSWSRLGNVYRHLKNYQEAVIAYQRADDLDPLNSRSHEEADQQLYHSMDPDSPATKEALLKLAASESVQVPDETDSEAVLVTPQLSIENVGVEAEAMPTLIADEPIELPVSLDAAQTEATLEVDSLIAWAEPDMTEQDEDPELASIFQQDPEVYFPDLDLEVMADWLPIPEPLESSAEALEQESLQENEPEPEADPASYFEFPQSLGPMPPLLTSRIEAAREEEYSEQSVQLAEIDLEEQSATTFVVAEQLIDESPGIEIVHDNEKAIQESSEALNIELEIPRLKRLVQVNPQNSVTWNTLGNLYKFAGLYKEAILAYQQATAIDTEKFQYLHNLGMVYAAEGRDEDAIICLQKVLELNPDHSLTHATLGGYYRKMGLDELAQRHIGKAMKHIYDSESEYNRACLEAICGNTDQAIDLLRVALENKQTYVDWVLRDPDLDMIREDRRFKQLISDFT
jgi:tetratricopeptide (TPR) repeat protein